MSVPEKIMRNWIAAHPDWTAGEGFLRRTLTLGNFREAIQFVNRVAEIAEKLDHHPDILIHDWNKVTLTLSTHSAGGITEKDLQLAEQIEELGTES